MTSIADKALLISIQNKDNKLKTLIVNVLRTKDVSDRVLEALDNRIEIEWVTWSDVLPYLQKHSRNKLFEVYCERFPPNLFDAAELFKMGYGKEQFEYRLCKELYDTSKGKGIGMYSYIFEALSEHGGPKSLEMMEVIKYDLYSVMQTNRIVADAISNGFSEDKGFSVGELKQLIDAKFLSDFFPRLESAIELLRLRGIQLPDESPNEETSSVQKLSERIHRVQYYMNKAVELMPKHPPEALNNMRKATEAICKDVLDAAFENNPNANKKPAAAFNSLEDMINRMRKEGLIPSSIENCLGSLKSFGNFASHDQEEDPQNITVEMAASTLMHLKTLVEWYETLISQMNKQTNSHSDHHG
jgi:hypothetical protein